MHAGPISSRSAEVWPIPRTALGYTITQVRTGQAFQRTAGGGVRGGDAGRIRGG
jgi:hypothetical protein